MSFGVTRAEGLRRLLTTAPVEADSFDFFRLCLSDFLNSALMELMVDWTLAGIAGPVLYRVQAPADGTKYFYITLVDGFRDDFSSGKCLRG